MVERHRLDVLDEMLKRYHLISRRLMLIEQHITSSRSDGKGEMSATGSADGGRDLTMARYYAYWEQEIFNALVTMIANGLTDFQHILNRSPDTTPTATTPANASGSFHIGSGIYGNLITYANPNGVDTHHHQRRRLVPLIELRAQFRPDATDTAVVTHPNVVAVTQSLIQLHGNLAYTAKAFIRWQRGTCIECAPSDSKHADRLAALSYHADTGRNRIIVQIFTTGLLTIYTTLNRVKEYLGSWDQYNTKYRLFDLKKLASVPMLHRRDDLQVVTVPSNGNNSSNNNGSALMNTRGRRPTAYYDRKLEKYRDLAHSVRLLEREKEIAFVSVQCGDVIDAVVHKTEQWSTAYGETLRAVAIDNLSSIRRDLILMARGLERDPKLLQDLTSVLGCIATVEQKTMEMELRFAQVNEQFDALRRYGIPCDPDQVRFAESLPEQWRTLTAQTRKKAEELVGVKNVFTASTRQQIAEFQQRLKAVREAFTEHGPGASDVDLEKGLQLMDVWRQTLADLTEQKDALVLSEKLFDLPPESYYNLYWVQTEMARLEVLYKVYQEASKEEDKWGATYFSELEAGRLTRATTVMSKHIRQLSDDYKVMSVYKKIEKKVDGFKSSVPLILMLKNDALRDRHWLELMRATSTGTQSSPQGGKQAPQEQMVDWKSLTLKKLFAMVRRDCLYSHIAILMHRHIDVGKRDLSRNRYCCYLHS